MDDNLEEIRGDDDIIDCQCAVYNSEIDPLFETSQDQPTKKRFKANPA